MGQKTGFSTVSLGAGSARRQRAVDSLIALDEEFEEHFSQSSREKRQAASSDSARLQWTDPQKVGYSLFFANGHFVLTLL
jgi:hypothetical protein